MWESSYYSVPYLLIGKQVDLCANSSTVRIYFEHNEVTLHDRATKKFEYKRKAEHAPPHKEAVLQCSRTGLEELAQDIGPQTHQYVLKMLSTPGIDKLAPARNLLRLKKEYGKENLEKACKRACLFQFTTYGQVKNILKNNLQEESSEKELPDKNMTHSKARFQYARDPEEYKTTKKSSWDDTWERLYPVPKYASTIFSGYLSAQADNQMDELILLEKEAPARGEKGPLDGHIPEPTDAWKTWNRMQACEAVR